MALSIPKRTWLWLALIVALSGCANGGWTRQDTYRHAASLALMTVDWAQTQTIATERDPGFVGGFRWKEHNPILGEHPEPENVTAYFIAGAALHTAIAMALPPDYREWYQYLIITTSGAVVANNFGLGIRIDF